jgi:hypothetical protein
MTNGYVNSLAFHLFGSIKEEVEVAKCSKEIERTGCIEKLLFYVRGFIDAHSCLY